GVISTKLFGGFSNNSKIFVIICGRSKRKTQDPMLKVKVTLTGQRTKMGTQNVRQESYVQNCSVVLE
ncbi:MAG: hypothetical protein ABW185_07945, partial [Sedimenticola sp.]